MVSDPIYCYRDYDPTTGKYVESDPIGLRGGLNIYAYVDENPLNKVDPKGLLGWPDIHGNWCGPGWTGGYRKPWDQLSAKERNNVKPPKDELDACCETHDKCYAGCRTKSPCDMEKQQMCLESCDRRLYFCSRESGGSGVEKFLIEDYMRRSTPQPEKGACCSN